MTDPHDAGSLSRRAPRRAASWLRPSLHACALGAVIVGGLPREACAYEVVQRGGKVIHVTSLAFSGTSALLATDQGRTSIESSTIEYYETFRRNLGQAGGNLVVFKTGALLRFDSLDIKDGSVGVKVGGGSTFTVPESLIDFEASVREGAMLRLPESAVSSVAVSRSGQRGAAPPAPYEEPPPQPEDMPPPPDAAANDASVTPTPPGRPTRPGRPGFNRPRRFGADRDAAQEGQDPQALTPPEEGGSQGNPPNQEGESVPFGGGSGRGTGGGQEQSDTAGQTVLLVSTTFSGEVGGLQVTVTFPPNLKVVQPVQFSGFASALAMPTVNAAIPGQVQLVAVNSDVSGPGVQAGGEFLRLTFAWTGRAPTAQQFAVAVKATDPTTGAELPEFPREITVL